MHTTTECLISILFLTDTTWSNQIKIRNKNKKICKSEVHITELLKNTGNIIDSSGRLDFKQKISILDSTHETEDEPCYRGESLPVS